MSSSYPYEAQPEEWMRILKTCWCFLGKSKYSKIVIGSQALSLHLLKHSERLSGRLDYRIAFPSKNLDLSIPALSLRGGFNSRLLRGLTDFLRGEKFNVRGVETLDAGERGLIAHIFIRLPDGKPFCVKLFSTIITLHPHVFMATGSTIQLRAFKQYEFLTLNPVDAVVTRIASPSPIEGKHVERLKRFIEAIGIKPEEVARRIYKLGRLEYAYVNLRRMVEKLKTHPWSKGKWIHFLHLMGL